MDILKIKMNLQKQLADEMGISIPTLQNYKLLADMIPELEERELYGRIGENIRTSVIEPEGMNHKRKYNCKSKKIHDV